jgi:hypothetical protein
VYIGKCVYKCIYVGVCINVYMVCVYIYRCVDVVIII